MKYAIVGFGSIGRRHLGNLLRLGVDDIVIVSSHVDASLYKTDDEIIPVVKDISQVIEQIDVMLICNQTNLHKQCIELCIKHKIHFYIEKPILCDQWQISDLQNKIREKQIIASVGSQFRFNNYLAKIKKIIEDSGLGQVMAVVSMHGEHIADYHPGEDYTKSYAANREQCGGVLLTQIHHIDYINWILGPFTHVFASSIGSKSIGNVDVESIVNYSLLSSETGLQVHGHMNYLQRPKSTKLTIICEHGKIHWDYESSSLKIMSDEGVTEEREPFDRNSMFLAAMTNFIESVKSKKNPISDIEGGIQALKIVDSIKKSVAERSSVVSIS